MSIRVVYLNHVARLSGGEIALVRALSALGGHVDPYVILGEDGPLVERLLGIEVTVEVLPVPTTAREVRKESVRPRTLGAKALAASAGYVWTLQRRLRELRPDLVHTNSLKADLYGGAAGRLAGIPVVWHLRDRVAPDYLPKAAVHLVRAGARILPTSVIANSHATLDTLPHLHRSAVVTYSVVLDAIPGRQPQAPSANHPFRIGTLGRLAPWKGQNVFLDAFARAFPDGDSEAWIVGAAMFGEEDYAASLHDQARQLGISDRVVFRGFQEDVWSELAQLDTLVHCSLIPEPFGQVVCEGMVAGVPVIAANAGGPAEIITDGVDGMLTPPGDTVALATTMRRLHDDGSLRHRLVTGGRSTATRFSPEQTAKALLAVYDGVLGQRR